MIASWEEDEIPAVMPRHRFLHWIGGRKQLNGYLYAVLVTTAAWWLEASFQDYATWLAVALLGTSAIVAFEDVKRNRT